VSDASNRPIVPFFELNDLHVVDATDGRATVSSGVTPWLAGTPELGVQAGVVALADCVLSFGASSLDSGRQPVTLTMHLDFWREPPRVGSRLTGTAAVDVTDGEVVLVSGRIEDADGIVATATLRSMLVAFGGGAGNAGERSSRPSTQVPVIETVTFPAAPWSEPAGAIEAVTELAAWKLAGIEVQQIGDGVVDLTARPPVELERTEGVVHGGAVPILGQLAVEAALATAVPGVDARRLDLSAEYLRPTPIGEPMQVRARVVHRSRRVAMVHAELLNSQGKPTARVYESVALGGA
jgi:uncharacterized protein (TIGR00369 family)